MREDEIVVLLDTAAAEVPVGAAPTAGLVRRGRRRRAGRGALVALAAAGVLAAGAVLTWPSGDPRAVDPGAPAGPPALPEPTPPTVSGGPTDANRANPGCEAEVPAAVIPAWARTGFSDPEPVAPYVLGRDAAIIAILFAQPLTSPEAEGRTNKILWVAAPAEPADPGSDGAGAEEAGPEDSGPDMVVEASLRGTDVTTTRTVAGGPGPSAIDLPQAGCWDLTLQWSGHIDTLSLRYVDPR